MLTTASLMPRARRVDRHSFNSLVVWYLAGLQSGRAEVLVEVDGAAHCAVCVEIVASIAAVVTSVKAHSASTALHGDAARWQLRQQKKRAAAFTLQTLAGLQCETIAGATNETKHPSADVESLKIPEMRGEPSSSPLIATVKADVCHMFRWLQGLS